MTPNSLQYSFFLGEERGRRAALYVKISLSLSFFLSWLHWVLLHQTGFSSCVWAWLPHSMWDLSSPTRDQTCVPCITRWILNNWTTREGHFKLSMLSVMLPVKESESLATQSCLTLWHPMDCSLPGSSIHGIFQARVLEWVAISFSRGSSQPRD